VSRYAVVIVDTANASSFDTTTVEGDGQVLGIVHSSSIADDSTGIVVLAGIYDVTCVGSVSIGDYLKTSTTAGSATSGGSAATGSFGIALEAGSDTEISCLLTIDSSAVGEDDLSDDDVDALQDVDAYSSQAGGDLLIWDGTDSWDNTAVSGDAALSSAGALTVTKFGFTDLSDPDDDNIFFWDDSDGQMEFLTIGAGLTITGNELAASGTPTVDLDDDAPILFGDDDDFQMEYVSGTGLLEISDGSNTLWSLTDSGTTGTLTVGDIAVNGGDITSTSGTLNININGSRLNLDSGELEFENESTSSPIIGMYARDSGANTQLYGKLTCNVSDSTDSSEDSYWTLSAFAAGSEQTSLLRVDADGDATSSGDYLASGGAITAGADGSERGILTTWDGSGGNTPGTWLTHSPDGTAYYLFVTDTGGLRYHTSLPTSNSDGTAVAGSMTSFDLDGDSGTTQTISDGNTLDVDGGSGVATVAGATDKITIALGDLTADWTSTGAFDIKLTNASAELGIMESAGGAYYGMIDVGDLGADRTYTLSADESGYIAIAPTTGSAAQVLQSDGDGTYSWQAAGMSSFTLSGDSGDDQSIGNGNTLDVAGGSGIATSGAATDTVNVALDALTADWSQSGAFDIQLANADSQLSIMESSGGTYYGIVDVGDLGADRTYTFASDEDGYVPTVAAEGSALDVLQSDGDGTYSWKTPAKGAIVLTAAGGKPDDGIPCADAEIVAFTASNVWALAFDPATDEGAWWMLALPSDYGGGTLTPSFYYTVASDWEATSDKVNWTIAGLAVGESESLATAVGTASNANDVWSTGETVDELLVSAGDAMTLAGTPVAEEFVLFYVTRDADDATNDTCTADARLISVKLEYTKN